VKSNPDAHEHINTKRYANIIIIALLSFSQSRPLIFVLRDDDKEDKEERSESERERRRREEA
jgi:hypothetical protein